MHLMIVSTDKVITFEGQQVRIWKGLTPNGIECLLLVRAVTIPDHDPFNEFTELLVPNDDEQTRMRNQIIAGLTADEGKEKKNG